MLPLSVSELVTLGVLNCRGGWVGGVRCLGPSPKNTRLLAAFPKEFCWFLRGRGGGVPKVWNRKIPFFYFSVTFLFLGDFFGFLGEICLISRWLCFLFLGNLFRNSLWIFWISLWFFGFLGEILKIYHWIVWEFSLSNHRTVASHGPSAHRTKSSKPKGSKAGPESRQLKLSSDQID